MTDRKISGLPTGSALTGAELLEMVQSSSSRQVTTGAVAALAAQDVTVTYPPSPTPVFATWLQAHVDAGTSAYWIWGDQTLAAPAAITISATLNNFIFDGGGATLTAGFTDTTKNLLSFTVPDSATASVDGFTIQNIALDGTGAALPRKVKHCLYLSCNLAQSSIFGFRINNVDVIGANDDGCRLFGNVFEGYIWGMLARDSNGHGLNFRNPTAGGGTGVISSIHVVGGSFRQNALSGIATSSDTAFQQPAQCPYVVDADIIQNGASGIDTPAGCYARYCHFENNSNLSVGNSGLLVGFSLAIVEGCVATQNNGKQTYLVNFGGSGGNIVRSSINNSGTTIHLQNTGAVLLDADRWTQIFNGVGAYVDGAISGWLIHTPTVSSSPTVVTSTTYAVLVYDTDITVNRAGTVTLTMLPSAYAGSKLSVRTIQAQTVVSAASNIIPLIGGAATTAILAATAGKWAELVFDNTNWQIMKGN